MNNNIKLSNKMLIKDKAEAFMQQNPTGRQPMIKNCYNRIKFTKQILLLLPKNSFGAGIAIRVSLN